MALQNINFNSAVTEYHFSMFSSVPFVSRLSTESTRLNVVEATEVQPQSVSNVRRLSERKAHQKGPSSTRADGKTV